MIPKSRLLEITGPNPPRLQTILQSYSNQNSVALAQKQNTDQWNRIELGNKPIHLDQLIFNKGSKKYTVEKIQVLKQVVLGKLDSHV